MKPLNLIREIKNLNSLLYQYKTMDLITQVLVRTKSYKKTSTKSYTKSVS